MTVPVAGASLLELRIYRCVPGRTDQAAATLRSLAAGPFARHGFRPLGFWHTRADGAEGGEADELVYLLDWRDQAEASAGWAAFHADPAMAAAMARAREQGPAIAAISSRFLTRLDGFAGLPA